MLFTNRTNSGNKKIKTFFQPVHDDKEQNRPRVPSSSGGGASVTPRPAVSLPHIIFFPPFPLSFYSFRGHRVVTVRSKVTSHPRLLAAPAAAGPPASCWPGSCQRRRALCSPLWLEGENTGSAITREFRSISAGPQMCVSATEVNAHDHRLETCICPLITFFFFISFSHRCGRCRPCRCPQAPPPPLLPPHHHRRGS